MAKKPTKPTKPVFKASQKGVDGSLIKQWWFGPLMVILIGLAVHLTTKGSSTSTFVESAVDSAAR